MNHDMLHDLIGSLCRIMAEENDALARPVAVAGMAELVAAKALLLHDLEQMVAAWGRSDPDWVSTLEEEARDALGRMLAELIDVAQHNALLLQRQITASEDLLRAIDKELRIIAGHRPATYARHGGLDGNGGASPLSIDRTL